MQQYIFTVEDKEMKVELALVGDWSLYDFAAFIIDSIGFDLDHAFGFYDNLKNTYASKEKYTLFADMGESEDGEAGVKETMLSTVFAEGKQMLFVFDYGDYWTFRVTCKGVKPSTAKRRARKLVKVTGDMPVQYPDFDEDEDWDDEK